MGPRAERKRWSGGYIHQQADGRPLYVLERKVGGRKFHISTRAHSERAAHEHLRRFEADPWRYAEEMRSGRPEALPVSLTADLVSDYWRWMTTRRQPLPASKAHARDAVRYLADWTEDLRGRDLRRLDLSTLKAALAARPRAQQHRIIAIKAFFSWLREERQMVQRRDDPTLDLRVPQASPEKHRRRKAASTEAVRAALAQLSPDCRDWVLLLAHVGWHLTELGRFARDPDSRIAPGRGAVLAVLQVRHKTGATTRTPLLAQEAVDAARRIRERGTFPRKRLYAEIRAACAAAGVSRFTPGAMRHTVATWAIEEGTSADVVADFLGHRDRRTLNRFYADVAVPTLPIRLPRIL